MFQIQTNRWGLFSFNNLLFEWAMLISQPFQVRCVNQIEEVCKDVQAEPKLAELTGEKFVKKADAKNQT